MRWTISLEKYLPEAERSLPVPAKDNLAKGPKLSF